MATKQRRKWKQLGLFPHIQCKYLFGSHPSDITDVRGSSLWELLTENEYGKYGMKLCVVSREYIHLYGNWKIKWICPNKNQGSEERLMESWIRGCRLCKVWSMQRRVQYQLGPGLLAVGDLEPPPPPTPPPSTTLGVEGFPWNPFICPFINPLTVPLSKHLSLLVLTSFISPPTVYTRGWTKNVQAENSNG